MSSIYHEVFESFADVPAIIHINGASSDSTVSLPFLHSCINVPRSVSNHDGMAVESTCGPARVPTIDGWFIEFNFIYTSVIVRACSLADSSFGLSESRACPFVTCD